MKGVANIGGVLPSGALTQSLSRMPYTPAWDYQHNCGKGRFRLPPRIAVSFRDFFPPTFHADACGSGKNPHARHCFRIGALGSVCQHCGAYVTHGGVCPVSGPLPEDEARLDAIAERQRAEMRHFLTCMSRFEDGFTSADIRKVYGNARCNVKMLDSWMIDARKRGWIEKTTNPIYRYGRLTQVYRVTWRAHWE